MKKGLKSWNLFQKIQCVCELNEMSEYSQSNISQHLKILRDAELIYPEKNGNKVTYHLVNDKIKDLIKNINKLI